MFINVHLIFCIKDILRLMVEMSGNKRGRPAVGLQTCICGYATEHTGAFKRHKSTCPMVKEDSMLLAKDEIIANLKEQLAAKDKLIKEMHTQMYELAKAPRTVTNNITVDSTVNVFGKESIEHISPEQIQALLADPANAVPQLIKLKHRRAPGGVNQNLRIPNKKRPIYQVVVPGDDGKKEWENKAKGEVLEQLYEVSSDQLEAEADEDTHVGSQFLAHQEKVRASINGEGKDGGRRYKEQLDKIHCVCEGVSR